MRVRATTTATHPAGCTVHLAREFGFCYGVDRAVDYAYQARRRFPERNVFLTGEIIHNPHVNDRLRAAGIRFLSDADERATRLGADDVVILPAFGVTVDEMLRLTERGCTLVDTTCGSVLNVWKNVVRYAQDGYTAVIHGKVRHEETRATASQALKYPQGRYLIVLDRDEARAVCDYIRHGGDRAAFLARFERATSPGFDPDAISQRIGCANQTTMLMSESLEIGEMFREAMRDRYGDAGVRRSFPRVRHDLQRHAGAPGRRRSRCSTQEPLDLMLVVGGYNSSNTCNLARICAARVPDVSTSPIPTAWCRPAGSGTGPWARHRRPRRSSRCRDGWLPLGRPDRHRPHRGRLDAQQHRRRR